MRRIHLLLLVPFLFLAGCTTYTYQGRITAMDSSQVEREVIVAWSKTDPWIGEPKADAIVLRTACGAPVTYDEKETGIFFFGVPGSDIPLRPELQKSQHVLCGQVLDYTRVEEIGAGKLKLEILCSPKAGRFVGSKRRYLKARNVPYEFDITETKEWSFLGQDVVLPSPVCNATSP